MTVKLAAICVLAALAASGQGVRVQATPEPMAVMESLGMRSLGLWSVALCSEAAVPRIVTREQLILALPTVRIVATERAKAALQYAQGRTWQARMASGIRYVLMGGTAGSALLAVRQNDSGRPACRYCAAATATLAVSTVFADQVARRLDSEVPALAPFLAGVSDEPLSLAPGACGTRTVFAALQSGAHVTMAVIP